MAAGTNAVTGIQIGHAEHDGVALRYELTDLRLFQAIADAQSDPRVAARRDGGTVAATAPWEVRG